MTMAWASVQQGDLDWQDMSRCKNAPDPELFWPDAHNRAEQETRADQAAAAWCRGCPALAACRAFADSREAEGLWAGGLRTKRGVQYTVVEMPSMRPVVRVCGTDAGYHRHRRSSEQACTACASAHAEVQAARRRGAVARRAS